jgi:ubiquinone biosynthesis protein UbiJ
MAALDDPALHTAALAALEAAINRALALDPASRKRLAELADCVFRIECTAPRLNLYLIPQAQGVRLAGVWEGPVTTSVRGLASDFTELATASDPAATLINGKLELHGDSAPLIRLQQILGGLDLDWEAPLVDTLGDVAGHQLAQGLRALFGWGRQAGRSLTRQIDEFIHEEARLTPPRLELEDFYHDVQDLVMQVDRLASRTARLRRRLDALKG